MTNSKKMREIMKRIKKRREQLNLSYESLSKRTGLGSSTLQRYETGVIQRLSIDKLESLAAGLEIEPYKLMGWDTDALIKYNINKSDANLIDLYKNYEALDEDGKRKLIEYSFDILASYKYLKSDSDKNT